MNPAQPKVAPEVLARRYKILAGGPSFRDGDGSLKGPGDTIDLADDVAAQHRSNLQLLGDVIHNPEADPVAEQPLRQFVAGEPHVDAEER